MFISDLVYLYYFQTTIYIQFFSLLKKKFIHHLHKNGQQEILQWKISRDTEGMKNVNSDRSKNREDCFQIKLD